MSISFEELLKSKIHLTGIPVFDIIYKEVVCQQGIADFVGVISKQGVETLLMFDDIESLDSGTLIFSLLKPKASRSKHFLKEKTGLSDKTINRVLKELLENGIIQEVKEESYILSSNLTVPRLDIWAFELKLSNWKRALFQALQYKAFANYSVVVFPMEKKNVLSKQISLFKELNVGILLFDTKTKNLEILVHAKKEKPSSKWHTFFTLGKLANQYNSENKDTTP